MKNILKNKVVAAVLIFILFWGLAYSSDGLVFGVFEKADQTLWPYARLFGKARHFTGKFLDDLNPLRSQSNILSKLDTYDFELSPKDIEYFFKPLTAEQKKTWVKPATDFRGTKLNYKGKSYEASLKLHGDTSEHWIGKKKSFQVKMKKGHPSDHTGRLLLIIPEMRGYLVPLFASRLAEKMGLPALDNSFAAVSMNGIYQGIYYREDRVDDAFLKRKNINATVLELSDNWVEDRAQAGGNTNAYYGGITENTHHDTPFDLEISNVKPVDSPHAQDILRKAASFFEAIRNKDIASFENALDIRRVGAIDAWRTLMGDRHSLLADNARMAYDPATGRFFFIPRSEGASAALVYEGGSFERWLDSKLRVVPFWEMLSRSPKIRAVRNEWVYYFITHEKEVLGIYDSLKTQYEPLLVQDETLPLSSRELRHQLDVDGDVLRSNLKKLKAQFEYHKLYVNVMVRGNRVELTVIPDSSMQPLRIDGLRFVFPKDRRPDGAVKISRGNSSVTVDSMAAQVGELVKGLEFGFELDADLKPAPTRTQLAFVFDNLPTVDLARIELKVSSVIDGKELPSEDVYSSIAREEVSAVKP